LFLLLMLMLFLLLLFLMLMLFFDIVAVVLNQFSQLLENKSFEQFFRIVVQLIRPLCQLLFFNISFCIDDAMN
jgi:hypothetical protein